MSGRFPTADLERIAAEMEAFEAGASIANTGTGARREGAGFEDLVATFWDAFRAHLVARGARHAERASGARSRTWSGLEVGGRIAFLPEFAGRGRPDSTLPGEWLRLDFPVDDMIDAYPGRQAAVADFAPETGPYARDRYPGMFSRMKTKFDDTIVLQENDTLVEKILLEYKTAKSSKGRQIDGNAHERLSFQVMQYLEIATQYPSCSLVVMANGAFARYRNKYHVNFRVQAKRLTAFRWFRMDHLCVAAEYARITQRVESWLFGDPEG